VGAAQAADERPEDHDHDAQDLVDRRRDTRRCRRRRRRCRDRAGRPWPQRPAGLPWLVSRDLARRNDADPEESAAPITGDALARASSAALAHTGGGRVTETEVGDEEGFFEVEVTGAEGSQVDIHLNERFVVLGSKADKEDAQ
jgi:hypothetical protein